MPLLCLDKLTSSRLNGFTDQLLCTAEQIRDHRAGIGLPLPCVWWSPTEALSCTGEWQQTAVPHSPLHPMYNEHLLPLWHQTQKTLNYHLVLEKKYIGIIVLAGEAASGRIKALAAFFAKRRTPLLSAQQATNTAPRTMVNLGMEKQHCQSELPPLVHLKLCFVLQGGCHSPSAPATAKQTQLRLPSWTSGWTLPPGVCAVRLEGWAQEDMGGTQWQQGNPCSQLIRGGNGHWSRGNCFVLLISRGEGGKVAVLAGQAALSRCSQRPALQCCSSTDTDTDTDTAFPGRLLRLPWAMCPQGPGDSSPLRLRGGKCCCSPHPSFSTRVTTASSSLLSASPRGTATHTKAGGKKGTSLLYQLLDHPSWTCWLPFLLPPPLCPRPFTEVTWPHSWNWPRDVTDTPCKPEGTATSQSFSWK